MSGFFLSHSGWLERARVRGIKGKNPFRPSTSSQQQDRSQEDAPGEKREQNFFHYSMVYFHDAFSDRIYPFVGNIG